MYFLSKNYQAMIDRDDRWWKKVFFFGRADRVDRMVDWVLQSYVPGDGLKRHPLMLHRNMWMMPEVFVVESNWIVSKAVGNRLLALGSNAELLQVEFDRPYRIAWDLSQAAIFDHDDDPGDQMIDRFTAKTEFASDPPATPYFEIIVPHAKRCPPLNDNDVLNVNGDLHLTRTASLDSAISLSLSRSAVDAYKVLRLGGGLLCSADAHDILADVVNTDWLAFERLEGE